jgi:DNA-binding CsgD family transcriptional regulator
MHALNKSIIDIYDSALHCRLAQFNEYALRELKKVVAFDSCALADLDVTPGRKVVVRTVYLDSTPSERVQDRIRAIGQDAVQQNGIFSSQDDTLVNAFMRRGQSVIADIAEKVRNPELLSYCRKYETAHSLAFVSARAFGPSIPTLGLWRASRRDAYTAQHAHDAAVFIPHLLQSRQMNRRLNAGTAVLPSSSAMLVSSFQGQVYCIDDDTIQLLQTEWKQWLPPFLPRELMDALGSGSPRIFVGKRITVQAEVSYGMLVLKIAGSARKHASLTPAEHRVAMLAVQGMQYKEIAKQIEVAPATVRNQLHSIYRKLGVSNKTALAAALPVHA